MTSSRAYKPPEQVFSYIETLIEEEIFPVLGSWFWPIDYV